MLVDLYTECGRSCGNKDNLFCQTLQASGPRQNDKCTFIGSQILLPAKLARFRMVEFRTPKPSHLYYENIVILI